MFGMFVENHVPEAHADLVAGLADFGRLKRGVGLDLCYVYVMESSSLLYSHYLAGR